MGYIVACICWALIEITIVLSAVYLIVKDKPGWGWLIFLAFVLSQVTIKND